MAALAAGDHYGVAKDADLYFVKAYWGFMHPDDAELAAQVAAETEEDGGEAPLPVTLSGGHRGMLSAYDQIKKVVRERDLEKKAVVLFSQRQYPHNPYLPLYSRRHRHATASRWPRNSCLLLIILFLMNC